MRVKGLALGKVIPPQITFNFFVIANNTSTSTTKCSFTSNQKVQKED